MRLEIKRGVALGGGVDAYPGDVVEVPDFFGQQLITRGTGVKTDKPLTGGAKKPAKGKAAAAEQKEGDQDA